MLLIKEEFLLTFVTDQIIRKKNENPSSLVVPVTYTQWAESKCLSEIVSNFGIIKQFYLSEYVPSLRTFIRKVSEKNMLRFLCYKEILY